MFNFIRRTNPGDNELVVTFRIWGPFLEAPGNYRAR